MPHKDHRSSERGHRHGGRGRAQRGDVRTAIMLVLAEEPMHGYQIMQAISAQTAGAWRPSPGAVYPTIAQLEDEGLVTTLEDSGRKLVSLTTAGKSSLAARRTQHRDPFAGFTEDSVGPDLRAPLDAVRLAVQQVTTGGTLEQIEAAERVLVGARRSLYLILAGEDLDAG